ncbi:MAG: flagellar type III secretion system protein FliR [Paenibacillaceae bacterium]|nr:flagellar type III secretion system protein FliR [Paenibacillaceae bacterium]
MEFLLLNFPNLLLIFCRITAFFVVAPVFSARNVPTHFKIGFSFCVALLVFGVVPGDPVSFDGPYVLLIVRETLVGLVLGFVAYIFFTIVQVAGSFIDMQIGFSMANIIDPMTGTQSPIIGNLKFVLATLLFVTFGGHQMLIRAVMDSYEWVPLSYDWFARIADGQLTEFLVKSFATSFVLAFQMAAPIVAALFLVDIGLGILAKTAPQFNLFVIGLPLKVLLGLLMLTLLFPGFISLFFDLFETMFQHIEDVLNILAGSAAAP